jgi:hypothetical protein
LLLNEIASPLTISNVGIGLEGVGPQTAFLMTLCFAGGTVANVVASRSTLASAATYVAVITDSIGFTFDNCIFKGNVIRANGSADGVNLQRCFDIDFDTCKLIGGGFVLATCARISFLDTIYHDHPVLTTNTTNPTFAWDMSAVCTDITIDGLTFDGLYMEAPYSGIVNIAAAGCARIKIRNLGTAADPLQCGTPEVFGQSWSRSTSTITVTHNAHGLKTGDIINVTQASDAAATPLGTKTVTVTGVNTFTYTGVSTGATSGTLAYYGANPATGISINNAAAANDVRIQRVYLRGLRGVAISCDNSTKNLLLESFWASPPSINAIGLAVLNGTFKNLGAVYNTTVQTAVYGTNFVDNHNADIMPDTTALSWSRVTTTCTVTLTDHRLKTNDLINVITSSSAAAVVLGQKVVTVLTKDTFTFACLNAGATSGTIDVQQTNGRVALFMNEDSPDTAISTIDAGTPKFTSAGALYAPNVNDQITFETPYYIIGHSAFGFNSPNIPGATNTNYDITYDLDQGSGYSGTFNNLLIARTGASGTNGAFTVTITDASSVNPGDYVSGTNVAPLAKVLSKASNTLTLDLANVGTVSGTLTFYHLPSETILDPAVGFKIKIRVKTVTANTSTINHINFLTVVTESDRAQTYALDTIPFTVNGLIAGSEVRAYAGTDPDTAIAIGGIESSGTSFTFEHSYGGSTGYIIVHKEDYEPIYVPLTYASEAESLLVQPRFDRNYGNP